MIRKRLLILLLLSCGPAQAQTSLSDQINAVAAAQQAEQARQNAYQRASAAQAARAAADQRAAQIALERQRAAAQKVGRDEAAAAQRAAHDEAMTEKTRQEDYEDQLRALQLEQGKLEVLKLQQSMTTDKKRDQAYEDELRALDVKRKTVELKQMETRAARENDFIDRDLKHQDAATDVVQSDADARRSLSTGAKGLLEDVGTAAIKREGRPSQRHSNDPSPPSEHADTLQPR